MLAYIDEKLSLVLKYPGMWGGEEALEPMVLMMLMVRQFVAFGCDDEQGLLKAYRSHLAATLGAGSLRLIDRLPEGSDRCAKAVEVLSAFVAQQRQRTS